MGRCALVVVVLTLGCTAQRGAGEGSAPVRATATTATPHAAACSKLGPHVNDWNGAAQTMALACPPLVKFLGVGSVPIAGIAAYKAHCPDGRVVLRMYTPNRYDGDPVADADAFWRDVFAPVRALPPSQRALIDYLEGPNEQDSTPTWPTVPGYRPGYFNAFLQQLVDDVHSWGFRPIVGSVSVGNPGGDVDGDAPAMLREILPAIEAAAAAGGGWSYHAYTGGATFDEAEEIYTSLRYRKYLEHIPELRGVPLFLTEGGFDAGGDPDRDGWRAHLSADAYLAWLDWFDARLAEDDDVVGVTLFSVGAGWPSFDLAPIADALAARQRACAPSCPCRDDVDNFCLYGPSDGCAMTQPGGYCDPDGDGDFGDADWVRGWYDFQGRCR